MSISKTIGSVRGWFGSLPMRAAKKIGGPVFRVLLRALFRLHNRIEIRGLEHVAAAGGRAVFIANHVSFVDAAILASHLPGNPVFAVNLGASRWWWMKLVMPFFECVTLDTRNPMAIKALVRIVEAGRPIVIFPEGRLTVTNGLMKVYSGPGMVADKAGAWVVPIRLEGVHFSPLSRLKGLNPVRFGRPFAMTVLEPRKIPDLPLKGSARREAVGEWLYDEMRAMMADPTLKSPTLYSAFLAAGEAYGFKGDAVEAIDPKTNEVAATNRRKLAAGAAALAPHLCGGVKKGDAVGILLPNSTAAVAVFLALQSAGLVCAMLNYTSGALALTAALKSVRSTRVVTSRAFVEAAKLESSVEALAASGAEIVWLEDVRRRIGPFSRLSALLSLRGAALRHEALGIRADDAAVVLFTSGSEGTPKGVVLSHANLTGNISQIRGCVDFSPADTVLNALPMFHSFGLTAGTLLPLLNGVKVFLFPNPLNYKAVPELAYDRNATILFGTDTFLTGYARKAHPMDFRSVRYIFAGAEKVKDSTRALFMEKFQRAIYEGYGSTECSPVIALNSPMGFKSGTVGRIMPLMEARLEPVAGVEIGGRLHVRGPNVMKGYLRAENPGVLEAPAEGWYDTGDIVSIDGSGFISILGRAKRFAKIAGEMVSLSAVEEQAGRVSPGFSHACAALKDERKGERLVLVSTDASLTSAALSSDAKARGISELAVPKVLVFVETLPLLGSGKIDQTAVAKIAAASNAPAELEADVDSE